MQFVQATSGSGGWPLNVFLTPDLSPVFGGTYFPGPNSLASAAVNSGTVGFLDVLKKMRDIWLRQESRCRDSAEEITRQLRQFAEEGVHNHGGDPHGDEHGKSDSLDLDLLEEAYESMARQCDRSNGGFGLAPKFPVATKVRFLLQLGQWPQPVPDIVGGEECSDARDMAMHALRRMARGGIRDHICTGFARYSVTADWSLPHFEKMLPDQALLLEAYLDAYILSQDQEMLGAIDDLAAYLTNEPIQRGEGGYFSSEDADSPASHTDHEHREGAFYVWTRDELNSVLGDQVAGVVAHFYGVRAAGNVPPEHDHHDELLGQNVLAISTDPETLSQSLNIPESQVVATIRSARHRLREHRATTRPRPRLDNKLVTAWNALTIAALARAAAHQHPSNPAAARTWLASALRAARFLRNTMWDPSSSVLWRTWYDGARSIAVGLADDYAATARAALELYAATFDEVWLQWADALADALLRRFEAPEGGFYTAAHPDRCAAPTAADGNAASAPTSDLLLRLKCGMDNSEPAANAVAACVLFKLASLLGGDERYERAARRTVLAFEPEIEHAPAAFPGLLDAVAWSHVGGRCVWIVGEPVERDVDGLGNASGQNEAPKALSEDEWTKALRSGLGLGQSVLRVRATDTWLRQRNPLVGALDVRTGEGLRVMVCEAGHCREVTNVDDL